MSTEVNLGLRFNVCEPVDVNTNKAVVDYLRLCAVNNIDVDEAILGLDGGSRRAELLCLGLSVGLSSVQLSGLGTRVFISPGLRDQRLIAIELLRCLALRYPILPIDLGDLSGPVVVSSGRGQLSCTWGSNKEVRKVFLSGDIGDGSFVKRAFQTRITVEIWQGR
ncbi:ORF2 [Grapevine virus J]|uniref:ORF2 n=1 Tax=Grapevine virus J TaxID=2093496 RepID=A0A2P1BXX0_9VIRU|nr:ORF2 [Grapevine virus J]AVI69647.1 ORF2 [Grapevine virus J]